MLDTILCGITVYVLFGFFGCIFNLIVCAPVDKVKDAYLTSGSILKWMEENKRLTDEAKLFLIGAMIILWLPLMIINLVFLAFISLKVSIRGIANIIWVVSTDLIAKETHIEPKQFDTWASQMEEFIESIPSSSVLNK